MEWWERGVSIRIEFGRVKHNGTRNKRTRGEERESETEGQNKVKIQKMNVIVV